MARNEIADIVIRKMTKDDVDDVVRIEAASFSKPWSGTLFFNEVYNMKSLPLVARIDNRIVGYICASRIIDEGHILNLAVHPDFRSLGIASALVDDIITHLKVDDCRVIFLEVRNSNKAARDMYESLGFAVMGIRKNYYSSPQEDAVLMVRRLDK